MPPLCYIIIVRNWSSIIIAARTFPLYTKVGGATLNTKKKKTNPYMLGRPYNEINELIDLIGPCNLTVICTNSPYMTHSL